MTSDAKIGLLLGLVFIFVIAFVINGLPGLHPKDDSNKLTTNMVGLQNSDPGLGATERKAQMEFDQPAPAAGLTASGAPGAFGSSDAQNTMTLPQDSSPATSPGPVNPASGAAAEIQSDVALVSPALTPTSPAVSTPTQSSRPAHPAAVAGSPAGSPAPAQAGGAAQKQQIRKVEPAKSAAPRAYVVADGDSLSSIAKKCYGEQQGNTQAAINALFQANRNTLASADELQVGQKLIIPSLTSSAAPAPAPGPAGVLSGVDFAKVDSVGKRNAPPAAEKDAKQEKLYTVREGDSLWRIAAEQLGDGNRYREILKCNADLLKGEDAIEVGVQLKLPPR